MHGRVTNKLDNLTSNLFFYGYDPGNRLTNRWTAALSNTAYRYDPLGNLTNVDHSVGTGSTPSIYFSYDGVNRLTGMIDGIGTTAFTWTPGDQLASAGGLWPDDTVTYTYNNRLPSGLAVLASDANAWAQSYVYDSYFRLASVTSPAGTFAYQYVALSGSAPSLISSLTLPNCSYITNTYDGLARLTNTALLSSGLSTINSHTYQLDTGSQRTQQVFTAGNLANYAYDNIGQLKTAQGFDPDGTTRLHEQFGYAYDKAWNLTSRTNNAFLGVFNVNSLNELTTETNRGTLTVAGTATERKAAYVGDYGVTNVTVSGTGLSSGAASVYVDGTWARAGATPAYGNNSYTATAQDSTGRQDTGTVAVNLPGTNTFTYDLNGNLLSDGTRYFAYDDENELTSVWVTNVWRSDFLFDGMMRRRVRREFTWSGGAWVKTNEVRYVYDRRLVLQERDANNLPLLTQTRGNDLSGTFQGAGGIGGLLARTDNGELTAGISVAHAFYHADGSGNITCLINSSNTPVARYTYDSFGNILAMSGPLAVANLYRFSSKELHQTSGLVYYGFRFYDPNLQKWVNRDPIGERGGINLFRPFDNNPISWQDSWGHFCGADDAVELPLAVEVGLSVLMAVALVEAFTQNPYSHGITLNYGDLLYFTGNSVPVSLSYPMAKLPGSTMPAKGGPANGSLAEDRGGGKGTIRDYDADGKAKTDYDFGHDHGAGDPHAHDWDWSKTPPRQPGRPLCPGE